MARISKAVGKIAKFLFGKGGTRSIGQAVGGKPGKQRRSANDNSGRKVSSNSSGGRNSASPAAARTSGS